MKFIHTFKKVISVALLLTAFNYANAQTTANTKPTRNQNRENSSGNGSQVEERNVRAQMEFLASDALQGRGSGTPFELLAGQFIASQMRQFGVEPAGDTDAAGGKTYIQTVNITRNAFADAPKLSYSSNGAVSKSGKRQGNRCFADEFRNGARRICKKFRLTASRRRAQLCLSRCARAKTRRL